MNKDISDAMRFSLFEIWGETGRRTQIKVSGNSMKPLIDQNWTLIINHTKNIKIGDIIVFKKNGEMIAHRVVRILSKGILLTKGDALLDLDPLVYKSEIIGRVIGANKGNKDVDYENPKWAIINYFIAKYSYLTYIIFNYLRQIRYIFLGNRNKNLTIFFSKAYRMSTTFFPSLFFHLI